jgi:hypothetical protein
MSCPCTAQNGPPSEGRFRYVHGGRPGTAVGPTVAGKSLHSNSNPPEQSIWANRNHVVVMFAAKAQTDDPGDRKKP